MRRKAFAEKEQVKTPAAPVYTATYKVQRSDTLLEFLLRKCNTSRNNVKALLVRKQVLVNGSVVTQYDFALAKDDEVKLSKRPMKEGAVVINKSQAKTKLPPRCKLKILYEDEEFLAVEKPCGLLSVESDKERESAFAYALTYLAKQGKRPFVLHRIDKETSGVLLFAKDIKIHSKMKMRWSELVQTREYYAVVEGILEEKSNTITSYLKENKNNLMYSTDDPSGQKAITHYEVLKEKDGRSLLRVKIDTGRKNQIRVHMLSLGCPVVGDDKYGKPKNPLGRLGLHASKLVFQHPDTGEILTIASSMPPVFEL